jgi:hypothetical protein
MLAFRPVQQSNHCGREEFLYTSRPALQAASGRPPARQPHDANRGCRPHAGQGGTKQVIGSRAEGSTSAALAGYVEHASRECLDYDRAVLNQGEDFPPVTDHLHPGRRIGG